MNYFNFCFYLSKKFILVEKDLGLVGKFLTEVTSKNHLMLFLNSKRNPTHIQYS